MPKLFSINANYSSITVFHTCTMFFRFRDSLISGKGKKQAVEQVETSLMMFTETQLFQMRQIIGLQHCLPLSVSVGETL